MIFRSILRHLFQNFDFWPFYGLFWGIFGRFSGIFCPWTSYRSNILTQEYFFWKYDLRTVSRNILWHFHFWPYFGGVAYENLRRETFAPGAVLCSSALWSFLNVLIFNCFRALFGYFWAFFRYFLSVDKLQVTSCPRNLVFKKYDLWDYIKKCFYS